MCHHRHGFYIRTKDQSYASKELCQTPQNVQVRLILKVELTGSFSVPFIICARSKIYSVRGDILKYSLVSQIIQYCAAECMYAQSVFILFIILRYEFNLYMFVTCIILQGKCDIGLLITFYE